MDDFEAAEPLLEAVLAVNDRVVVALVNGGSASASEIVSGAIKVEGRAPIVGEQTFGTGTILNTIRLSDQSALRLGVREWLTPTGEGVFRVGVTPDIITTAKGLTNGVIPMGAVLVRDEIYEAFMHGPHQLIELFHGYTYSGHPVAAAAGVAPLEAYEEEGTFEQARSLEGHFEDALHSLADHPLVTDVRNFGLMGGVDLASLPGSIGTRGLTVHKRLFWEENVVVRHSADLLQFAPFLNSRPEDISMTIDKVRKVLDSID